MGVATSVTTPLYEPGGCTALISVCHPTRVVSEDTLPVLHATSSADVLVPAHLLPPPVVKRAAVPVQSVASFVVYPKNPVFTLADEPAGELHVAGDALVPVNTSMFFEPSVSGGSDALTVTT